MYNVCFGIVIKYILRFINFFKLKLLFNIFFLSFSFFGSFSCGNIGSNSFNRVGNDRLYSGEKKDFFDIGVVGEEYDKLVDIEILVICRREIVFEII